MDAGPRLPRETADGPGSEAQVRRGAGSSGPAVAAPGGPGSGSSGTLTAAHPSPQLDDFVGAHPDYDEEEEERKYFRRKRLGVLKNVVAASLGGTLTYGVYLGTARPPLPLYSPGPALPAALMAGGKGRLPP